MKRLSTRAAAMHLRLGHDYLDLLAANRRRIHPDKQTPLIADLRAEIARLQDQIARQLQRGAQDRRRSVRSS